MPSRPIAAVAGVATVLVLALAPFSLPRSELYSLADVLILGLFAVSYNLLFGHLGMLSFGHAAYFGVGAYATALCLAHVPSTPSPLAILVGSLAGAAAGVVIGNFCVRLSGPYFAMLTLAFGQLLFAVAWKWRAVTKGDDGFGGFVRHSLPAVLPEAFLRGEVERLYYFVLAVVIPVLVVLWALMKGTPFGNAVVSIRQNEERASFLGYDVFATRLVTYTIASWVAGLAGSLFAIAHDFVSPGVIDIALSTDVVLMTVIGGSAVFFGPLVGALLFVYFRDVVSTATDRWPFLLGLVFVTIVLYAPGGLTGLVRLIPKPRVDRLPSKGAR